MMSGFYEPYANEPLADAACIANYNKEMREKEEKCQLFTKRLNKEVPVVSW